MTEQRFYFDGLFYANEEEFRKAHSHWVNSEISPISSERILQHMCKDIALNLFNPYGDKKLITNGDLSGICSRFTLEFIAEFRKALQDMHKEKANET